VVLATSIAETSLTIEGVRIVVDCGLARVPRFEPDLGLTRLETVRVSRAAADQRRGRAGRTEPGVCYRLWDEAQEGAFPAYATPEILAADLSSFLLDCAAWGVTDPTSLAFLDPPPKPALAEARALLESLAALDADGRITSEGKLLRGLPLTPRLARMVVDASARGEGRLAADLALLVSERGLGGEDVHLGHRLDRLRTDRSRRAEDARRMAAGWLREVKGPPDVGSGPERAGAVLALAFPDRIARARGKDGDFVLANGRGGSVDPASPLARETFLAVAEIGGVAARARILSAAPISLTEIEEGFASRIETREEVAFDKAAAALRAKRSRRLGAVNLGEQTLAVPADEASAARLAEGIAQLGLHRLPWTKAQLALRHRVAFLRRVDESFPDLSDATLAASAVEWLAPHMLGKSALSQIGADDLGNALDHLVPWDVKRRIETDLPSHFDAPSGQRHPIDYEGEEPVLSIRVQELFGLAVHPSVARGKIPLVVELLSPAHRPVQVTRDLPGFWKGSWQAVKSDMKGRYPRHPWPDDPAAAAATHRAKPRGREGGCGSGRAGPVSPVSRRGKASAPRCGGSRGRSRGCRCTRPLLRGAAPLALADLRPGILLRHHGAKIGDVLLGLGRGQVLAGDLLGLGEAALEPDDEGEVLAHALVGLGMASRLAQRLLGLGELAGEGVGQAEVGEDRRLARGDLQGVVVEGLGLLRAAHLVVD
jgi:ATP-dependent helicase HrpB